MAFWVFSDGNAFKLQWRRMEIVVGAYPRISQTPLSSAIGLMKINIVLQLESIMGGTLLIG